jgi:hypothetical protein
VQAGEDEFECEQKYTRNQTVIIFSFAANSEKFHHCNFAIFSFCKNILPFEIYYKFSHM